MLVWYMFRKFLLLFTLFAFVLGNSVTAAAAIGYEQVNPKDGFNYGLKRFREKVSFFLKFSKDSKAKFLEKQVNMRLSELKYTINQKDMANFESATTRYFATVGQYTDFLKEKDVSYNKEEIVKNFDEHIAVIKELQKNFDSATAEWRFLEDDINYIKIYLGAI